MLSGVSLVSIFLIGALWVSYETNRSEKESLKIKSDYVAGHEATISLETNRICDYMEAQRQSSEIKFLKSIKDRVYEIFGLIEGMAETPTAALSRQRTQETILAGLGEASYNQGRGRYFVATLTGQELINASDNLNAHHSAGNDFSYSSPATFMEIAESLGQIKEGFFRYNLMHGQRSPGEEEDPQVAYLKVFEPYGWIIGTSEYMDDWERGIKAELLDWSRSLALPSDHHLMILSYSGDMLVFPDKMLLGKNIFADPNANPDFQRVAAEIIRGAKDRNKDFIRYATIDPETGDPIERIAYFRAIPSWRWVVVTWVYFQDLEAVLTERQASLADNVRSQITRIVAISISMLLVIMVLSKLFSTLATRSFSAFFEFFERASTASIEINPDEQPFEEFARLAVSANSMINQRKLATNLLRESELKFKTIFDVSPQVITMSEMGGILLDCNEEYRRFSRLPLEEAKGRCLEDSFVLSAEKREAIWAELKDKGSIVGREVATANLSGSPLFFLVFGKMIHMHHNSFILAIFTDITDLKAAENEKLILQEKLSRSTKMEAMGLMAAEVAHDLNNILSGIIGYPQLLLMEENITEKQKEALKEILETGQRAAAVVSDLLTIARGVASTKVSIPVNNVVNDYVNSPECKQLQEIFPNVALELQLSREAGNIIASPIHLTKVVMNLVSNAFEAMPPDQKDSRVIIRTENFKLQERLTSYDASIEPGEYARIQVIDNGPGIPAEDVGKIFEPFYSKKTKGRSGTGLGLAIVWNTINDHHGYLDVVTSSRGTAFSLYLKLTQEKTTAPAARKKLDDYKGAGQRILVVDDVDIQRKLASKMLTTLGYEPVAVPSGEAAVEFLKTEDVDLVILDMIMHPGMNGRETYGAIMEFKPHQKAIIASGMAETDEVAKAQAMGAGQFVNKPYTIEDLAVAVQKALC